MLESEVQVWRAPAGCESRTGKGPDMRTRQGVFILLQMMNTATTSMIRKISSYISAPVVVLGLCNLALYVLVHGFRNYILQSGVSALHTSSHVVVVHLQQGSSALLTKGRKRP